MKHEVTKILSKVSNRHTSYVKLTELPTKFRSYPDNTNIFTRRMFMTEAFDLTQLNEMDELEVFEAVARAYEDIIISDNPDFTLYDLELVDFQLAIAVSTIWSTKKSGWGLNITCPEHSCRQKIIKEITIDDFNFTDNVVQLPVPITLDGVEFEMRTLTVGNIVEINRLMKKEPKIKRGILEFAYMLTPVNEQDKETLKDIYKFLCYITDEDVEDLVKLDQEITVKNYPLEIVCPHCGSKVKINKQLNDLKVYL